MVSSALLALGIWASNESRLQLLRFCIAHPEDSDRRLRAKILANELGYLLSVAKDRIVDYQYLQ
jgi:hypothetical protein